MKYSTDMISQALMINNKEDVVVTTDRERTHGHMQMLQTFITSQTRNIKLFMCYLPENRPLDVIALVPVRYHNPQSQANFRNRLDYISVTDRQRVQDRPDGSQVLHNSNTVLLDKIRTDKIDGHGNPFNTLFVSGHFRTVPVPTNINDMECVHKFQMASHRLIQAHNVIKAKLESTGIDVGSNTAYRNQIGALYAEYQQCMFALIEAGHVTLAQAIVVKENGLIPAFTLHSGSKSSNPYLDTTSMLDGKASYIPILNQFIGHASIESSARVDDMNNKFVMGISELNSSKGNSNNPDDTGDVDTTSRGVRHQCSRLANVHDTLGNSSSVIFRRMDIRYTSNGQQSMSAAFEAATGSNQKLVVFGAYSPLAVEEGVQANVNGLTRASVNIDSYSVQQSTSLITDLASTESLGDANFMSDDDLAALDAGDFVAFDLSEAMTKGGHVELENNQTEDLDNPTESDTRGIL